MLSKRDLAKRFDVGNWAEACFGLDPSRFQNLFDIGNFFQLIVPIMSTPCFPTASTLLQCAVEGGLKGLSDGQLFHPPDISKVRGCLCQNADFMGELAKCYNCSKANGANMLPDLSSSPGAGLAANFCSNGGSSSTALQQNSTSPLQEKTVTSAPTASNAVVSTGAPSSAPGLDDPDGSGGFSNGPGGGGNGGPSLPSAAPDQVSAASPGMGSLPMAVSTFLGVFLVMVTVVVI
ncbi:hypothetical protein KEM56_006516 [Ascosphaera pollenicola]|nr:hypothetical protein KEM56_006516 [Ascosphaera pollenicola]